jgi:homoserine/homoserine lactone efflux protein
MSIEIWLAYIGTVLVLMSTPGPSQLLMLSNSIGNGFRRSIATAAGDLSANFLQMSVASIGLVSAMQNSREFFIIIKWVGVAYLLYLGFKQIVTKADNQLQQKRNLRSIKSLYWQGFITSAANPKAVIFFAALFPQFINPTAPLLSQFAVLSSTYIVMDGIFLCCYGKSAEWISNKLRSSGGHYINQISGSFLIGAAILLGLKNVATK